MTSKQKTILVGSLVVIFLIYFLYSNNIFLTANVNQKTSDEPFVIKENDKAVYVFVQGEVMYPDLYLVSDKTLVYDLLKLAGLKESSDISNINLAEFVKPNHSYYINKIEEPIIEQTEDTKNQTNNNSSNSQTSTLVNLNTATLSELMTLTGIGEVTANKIIEYRETKKFDNISEIMNVAGIKEKTFEKIKDFITV